MYEQRAETETDQFEPQGPWRPAGVPILPDRAERASHGPWYVVVDELHGVGCRLSVDLWPDVDADGRLVFETDLTVLRWVATEIAQRVIRDARQAAADGAEDRAIADRALRIGDVFAVWASAANELRLEVPSAGDEPVAGVGSAPGDEPAGGLVDVTGEARVATRAAVDAVGAGELTEADLRLLGIPESAVQEIPDSRTAT